MSTRRQTPVHVKIVKPSTCSTELRLYLLQQASFFADLPESEIHSINKQFREFGFQAGDTIYFSGDPATNLYIIASGQVRLLRHSTSGQDVLLDVLKPGEFFGSLTMMAEERYPDTAQAQTAVCVLSIQSEAFRTLLQKQALVALKILDITAQRLQETQEMVRRLSADSVEQRIAAVLLKLAHKLGEITPEGILIQMPLSRDDLAQMAGTTTETASRIVSRFQKKGLVHSGRQWIALTNKPSLELIAAPDS